MLGASVPSTICFTSVAPILLKMEGALAHDANEQFLVKLVLAINGLAMVIGAPLAGHLADRFGRVRVATWSTYGWFVLSLAGYFIDNLYLMVADRLIVGILAAFSLTACITMIGDLPERGLRDRLMGHQVAIAGITSIAGMTLSGVLADINWRLPFLTAIVIVPVLVMHLLQKPGESDGAPVTGQNEAHVKSPPFPVGLILLALAGGAATFAATTYIPFRLRDLGNPSATFVALALTCGSAAVMVVAATYGFARQYISSQTAFVISFGLNAIGGAVIAFAPTVSIAFLGVIIMGLGSGWFTPNLMSRAALAGGTLARARMVGYVKGAFVSSSFISAVALEPVFRVGGASAVVGAIGALALCVAVWITFAIWQQRAQPLPEQT